MIDTAPVLALLFNVLIPGVAGAFQTPANHSLIYYYTELTKDLSPLGFHEFTALGLLDEWKLYYYNSQNQFTRPEHGWMRESLDVEHLIHNPEELQRLRDWFRRQNEIVGNCTWPCPDLHVLQRRFGCEIKEHQNGSVHFLRAIEEYGYDGQDFISFDVDAMQWNAEVPKARMIKRSWDEAKGRIQSIRFYLKNECVESLSNVLNHTRAIKKTLSSPGFQTLYAKKSCDKNTLVLTCLASGFFPKDVKMSLRKFTTSLPEHLLTSSGVRPNDDGTYQLRKSVEIKEEETGFSCRIEHSCLDAPVTVEWDGNWQDCEGELRHKWILVSVGVLFVLVIVLLGRFSPARDPDAAPARDPEPDAAQAPAPAQDPDPDAEPAHGQNNSGGQTVTEETTLPPPHYIQGDVQKYTASSHLSECNV